MFIKIDVRKIDPFSLPALPLEDRLSMPNVCAIYFALSKQREILYIGRAQHLGQRWHTHHRLTQLESIGGVKIAWLVIEPHVLIDPVWLEEVRIQYFRPLLNETENPLNMGNSYSLEEQSRGPVTLYQKYVDAQMRQKKTSSNPKKKREERYRENTVIWDSGNIAAS